MNESIEKIDFAHFTVDQDIDGETLAELNQYLETLSAQERVAWAFKNLPGSHMVSSSFGAQSAVMLHMLTQQQPDIPVVLTDTGYLFSETYSFVEELKKRLNLNLHVYRADRSREQLPVLQKVGGRFKLYPIIDWTNKDLHYYLKDHDLPYHPLWEQGYVSIGDWHTTRSLEEGMKEQDTRFFGLKRECGLHEFGDGI